MYREQYRRRRSIKYRKKKRRQAQLKLLLVMLVLGIGGTLMFLTHITNTVTNAFSVGSTSIEIVEPGVDPGSVSWGAESKPVYLKNPSAEDSVDGVVRAMIVPRLIDKETGQETGGNLGSLAEPAGSTLVLGDITLHFAGDWSSNWFYKDGYFYCRRVLKPGETSPQLLAGVTLTDASKAEEYQNLTVKIEVMADILQADGTAAQTEWEINVSNGMVSP